jgi:hypothetical protein
MDRTAADSAGRGAPASPRIRSAGWGRVEVEGRDEPFKDAKLWPGGSRVWDWTETGTRHDPGVQPADVRELVEHGARRVVLSRGRLGRLRVQDATLSFLEEAGVEAEVLDTGDAVRRYNELARRAPVGALIHSTC